MNTYLLETDDALKRNDLQIISHSTVYKGGDRADGDQQGR